MAAEEEEEEKDEEVVPDGNSSGSGDGDATGTTPGGGGCGGSGGSGVRISGVEYARMVVCLWEYSAISGVTGTILPAILSHVNDFEHELECSKREDRLELPCETQLVLMWQEYKRNPHRVLARRLTLLQPLPPPSPSPPPPPPPSVPPLLLPPRVSAATSKVSSSPPPVLLFAMALL
ncbi:hypothetical protein M0804_008924 [Polistes exclamans]|nr:hypothetical protein M0804_008924 [Polistes exclamans]